MPPLPQKATNDPKNVKKTGEKGRKAWGIVELLIGIAQKVWAGRVQDREEREKIAQAYQKPTHNPQNTSEIH